MKLTYSLLVALLLVSSCSVTHTVAPTDDTSGDVSADAELAAQTERACGPTVDDHQLYRRSFDPSGSGPVFSATRLDSDANELWTLDANLNEAVPPQDSRLVYDRTGFVFDRAAGQVTGPASDGQIPKVLADCSYLVVTDTTTSRVAPNGDVLWHLDTAIRVSEVGEGLLFVFDFFQDDACDADQTVDTGPCDTEAECLEDEFDARRIDGVVHPPCTVEAYSVEDGSLVWKAFLAQDRSYPSVVAGHAIVSTANESVTVHDPLTGDALVTFPSSAYIVAPCGNTVWFIDIRGSGLHIFDRDTGEVTTTDPDALDMKLYLPRTTDRDRGDQLVLLTGGNLALVDCTTDPYDWTLIEPATAIQHSLGLVVATDDTLWADDLVIDRATSTILPAALRPVELRLESGFATDSVIVVHDQSDDAASDREWLILDPVSGAVLGHSGDQIVAIQAPADIESPVITFTAPLVNVEDPLHRQFYFVDSTTGEIIGETPDE